MQLDLTFSWVFFFLSFSPFLNHILPAGLWCLCHLYSLAAMTLRAPYQILAVSRLRVGVRINRNAIAAPVKLLVFLGYCSVFFSLQSY
ncbi:hypothetical protein HOY80DRAFT_945598 [Tuber brumale]|nr:hypothetical protein HOY80DRAFT_945598 [Tuber brumale]